MSKYRCYHCQQEIETLVKTDVVSEERLVYYEYNIDSEEETYLEDGDITHTDVIEFFFECPECKNTLDPDALDRCDDEEEDEEITPCVTGDDFNIKYLWEKQKINT